MHNDVRAVRVGSRGSALAVRQSTLAIDLLEARFPDVTFRLETIQTTGDRVQHLPISQFGDKGVFVRALESALLDGRIDIAVHSLKDVPTDVTIPQLALAGFPMREDARDVLIARSSKSLKELPAGTLVGTSSMRRRMQLMAVRPDCIAVDVRGNVDTRLAKLDDGRYDAILLAAAGLHRLGLRSRISEYLPESAFVPDAGQGVLALQVRRGDRAEVLAEAVDHPATRIAALAERAVVHALGADCRSPVGAYATVHSEIVHIRAVAARSPGECLQRDEESGPVEEAPEVGRRLGERLRAALEL